MSSYLLHYPASASNHEIIWCFYFASDKTSMLNFPKMYHGMLAMQFRFNTHLAFTMLVISGICFSQSSRAEITPIDCKNSTTFVEKTICSNPTLESLHKELDIQLEAAATSSKVPPVLLEFSHQDWLIRRNKCKNTECIEKALQNRLDEIKQYNVMNPSFIQYYIRQQQPTNDKLLSVMEIQKLDEKRIRIIIKSYNVDTTQNKTYLTAFSGYTKQAKRIRVKDLDTQCQIRVNTVKNQLEVRQASSTCGNKYVRFSGLYQLQR